MEYVDGITYENVKRNLGYDFMDVNLDEHLLFIETTSDEIEELMEKLP